MEMPKVLSLRQFRLD